MKPDNRPGLRSAPSGLQLFYSSLFVGHDRAENRSHRRPRRDAIVLRGTVLGDVPLFVELAKRSLSRLTLRGVGLASKNAVS